MVGENIKKYLLDHGISQSFLSEKTKIPSNTLNQALNNKRRLMVEEYFIICEALQVPYEKFVDRAS